MLLLVDQPAARQVAEVARTALGEVGHGRVLGNLYLTEKDGGTLLTYNVEAQIGGKLAQLGSRIIDGFAKKMADEFFQRFQQAVEGPVTVAEEEAAPEEPAPEGEPKKGWFKRLLG